MTEPRFTVCAVEDGFDRPDVRVSGGEAVAIAAAERLSATRHMRAYRWVYRKPSARMFGAWEPYCIYDSGEDV